VADAKKCKLYRKNFGEFFCNQIEHAGTVILSHTTGLSEAKVSEAVELVRSLNESAEIITTPWEDLSGKQILDAMENKDTIEEALHLLEEEHHHH
jgi:G3E family GTPase